MKKILIVLLAFFIVSCENFEDLNKNVKSPTEVPGATLFSNAQKNLVDQMASINVNVNNFNLWSQYITETTYTDESNFDIFNRAVPDNAWSAYYRDVLKDLAEAESVLAAEEFVTDADKAAQINRIAIIDVLRSYTYYRMVTLWGDIPFTDALNVDNVLPKYEGALTIYQTLLTNINSDIASMNDGYGSFGSGSDVIYNGDVELWLKFANSLKVKLAITLADVSGFDAKGAVESAVASGVFTSNADNALFAYLGASPNTNPLWVSLVASGRSDYVATNTIGDKMNALNDPRIPLYYKDLDNGQVVGGVYGASNAYPLFSHLSEKLEDPEFPATLIDYSEVEFYLAEAAERGYSVGDDAETHYNKAVTASIMYWGGSAADASAYLAQADVAYATAPGTWKEKIGTQAWISFFNRGFEGWTEFRRLDYPMLPMPADPTSGVDSYAVRYTYPINEQTLNAANYTAAASAIGGDKLTTKLFWDVN